MAEWHHGLDGHESECTPGDGDGQGSLVYFSAWCGKQSDMPERLDSNNRTLKRNIETQGPFFKIPNKNMPKHFLKSKPGNNQSVNSNITVPVF